MNPAPLIPFDAPFLPDEPGDRLNADGSRDTTHLIVPIRNAAGVIVDHEVKF